MRLYLEKRVHFVRFFTARTGSKAEAEDLVQALYFKVRQAESPDILNGMAYIYRLGMNLMLDRLRSERRRQRREDVHHAENMVIAGGEAVASEPTAEDAADARLRLERLLRVANRLPPQCRRVFRMHKLDGMAQSEVAIALGISLSAVEKQLAIALHKLASEFEK